MADGSSSGSTTVGGCCAAGTARRWAARLWSDAHRRKQLAGDGMKTELRRCLTTADLVLFGLGHMMGAGIYVITGAVMVQDAGASTVLSYAVASLAAMLSGLCYAQFSVNIPRTGSAYNYVYFVFGEVWGFLAGWNLILEYLILVASVGRSLSSYIDALSGGVIVNGTAAVFGNYHTETFGPVDPLGGALILLVFFIVAVGVRGSVNVNNGLTVVNIIVILLIAIASFAIGNVSNFSAENGGFFPHGVGGMIRATGVVFFTYVGFDAIAIAAEETADPSKSLPSGMIAAIVIVTILYCSASFGLSLLQPYYEISLSVPFPEAFRAHGVNWLAYAVNVGAFFGMIASLLGQAFCLPRSIYAIAEDGLLFSPLKYVNAWAQTPLVSIAVSACISAMLALLVPVTELVQMVSIGTLFAIVLMTACLLKVHYIPGPLCPFELNINGVNFFPKDIQYTEESTPVTTTTGSSTGSAMSGSTLSKGKGQQTLHSIGQLRFHNVPLLGNYSSENVTTVSQVQSHPPSTHAELESLLLRTPMPLHGLKECEVGSCLSKVAIGALIVGSTGLTAVLGPALGRLTQGDWVVVVLFIVFLLIFITCTTVLLMYEHNTSFAKFSVPLVPWMPIMTLIVNLTLMMTLTAATWIRLFIWGALGLLIYFTYGIHHSVAGKEGYVEMRNNVYQDPTDVEVKSQKTEDDSNL